MNTETAQLDSVGRVATRSAPLGVADRARDYAILTKPEVLSLILLATGVGFYLGSAGSIDLAHLFHAVLGAGLVAGGTGALNQVWEIQVDARMRRTADRPLPAGRMHIAPALIYGLALAIGGGAYLYFMANPLAAMLAAATLALYLFVYTPLKTRTRFCTWAGAIPGALPPMIGWAAARGDIGPEAWSLFAIQYLWQFPHFLAIAWLYREDYARAGVLVEPVADPSGRSTFQQMIATAAVLIPVSVLPWYLGMSGSLYLAGALALGLGYLALSAWAVRNGTDRAFRFVIHGSILYLPAVFLLLMFDGRF